jgi:DNA-binding MarR family transcriptional regulator
MAQKTPESRGAGRRPRWEPDARRRLPVLLRHAWYALNQAFRRRIAHTGLTPDQFTALRTLLEGDPRGLIQRQLTQQMASDANTIAALLDRMEGADLVRRLPHESDRRASRITVSASGRTKFEEACAIAVDLQQEVLAALPPAARVNFLKSLGRVAMASKRALENSPPMGRPPTRNAE